MGHRIVVQIETNIGRLADADLDAFEQGRGVVGQRQQTWRLIGEHLAHGAVRLAGAAPVGGETATPGIRLGIEVVEIGEAAGREKGLADVTDGTLYAALLVAARHGYGTRLEAVVSGKLQQRGMESDRVTASFQYRTFKIIIEQDTWNPTPRGEGGGVAAQEILHPRVEVEAQKDLARMAQHHDERHQRTPRPADLEMAEVAPVDLTLFAGQAAQPQIGFGLRTRPMAGDQVAEMIRPAAVAALAHHRIQATRS